jgi:hypothetical protein
MYYVVDRPLVDGGSRPSSPESNLCLHMHPSALAHIGSTITVPVRKSGLGGLR